MHHTTNQTVTNLHIKNKEDLFFHSEQRKVKSLFFRSIQFTQILMKPYNQIRTKENMNKEQFIFITYLSQQILSITRKAIKTRKLLGNA